MEHDPDETVNLSDDEKYAHTIEEHARLLADRLAAEPPRGLKLLDLADLAGASGPINRNSSVVTE